MITLLVSMVATTKIEYHPQRTLRFFLPIRDGIECCIHVVCVSGCYNLQPSAWRLVEKQLRQFIITNPSIYHNLENVFIENKSFDHLNESIQ